LGGISGAMEFKNVSPQSRSFVQKMAKKKSALIIKVEK